VIYSAVFEKSGTGCVAYRTSNEVQTAVGMLNGSACGSSVLEVDFFTKPDDRKGSKGKGKGKSSWTPSWGGKGGGFGGNDPVQKLISMLGGGDGFGKGKGKGKGKKGQVGDMKKLKTLDNSLKVWVGGLTKAVTWKQLEEHFNQIGKCTWATVFPKGTGCVAYETAEEAATAISTLNGSVLGDCVSRFKQSETQFGLVVRAIIVSGDFLLPLALLAMRISDMWSVFLIVIKISYEQVVTHYPLLARNISRHDPNPRHDSVAFTSQLLRCQAEFHGIVQHR